MPNIDLEAFETIVSDKAEAAKKPKVIKTCKGFDSDGEPCQLETVPRSNLCELHRAEAEAAKAERVKGYKNIVRDAVNAAKAFVKEHGDDTTETLVRVSDGRSGFAYFAKEYLPNSVVKNHNLGGLVMQYEGTAYANIVGTTIANSEASTLEGFTVKLITTETVDGWLVVRSRDVV